MFQLFTACCSPVFHSVLHIFHTSAHPNEEPHSNNYIGNPRGQQIRNAQAPSMQQPVLFRLFFFIFLLCIFSHKFQGFPPASSWCWSSGLQRCFNRNKEWESVKKSVHSVCHYSLTTAQAHPVSSCHASSTPGLESSCGKSSWLDRIWEGTHLFLKSWSPRNHRGNSIGLEFKRGSSYFWVSLNNGRDSGNNRSGKTPFSFQSSNVESNWEGKKVWLLHNGPTVEGRGCNHFLKPYQPCRLWQDYRVWGVI